MPRVVEAVRSFEVDAPIEKVWSFFQDMRALGSCIPGCEEVTITAPGEAQFRVKLKVGYISKSFRMKVRVVDAKRHAHMAFTGIGEDGKLLGTLDLKSLSPSTTAVDYKVTIEPMSALGRTAISLVGEGLVNQQTEFFAKCVREKLGQRG